MNGFESMIAFFAFVSVLRHLLLFLFFVTMAKLN
jgi:hypothetical protein